MHRFNKYENPQRRVREVSRILKAIHAQESLTATLDKPKAVVKRLRHMKLNQATQLVNDLIHEMLTYYHNRKPTGCTHEPYNPLERVMREVRRRTRVVDTFPDGQSALMLVVVRLRHLIRAIWGERRYLSMQALEDQDMEARLAA